MHLFMIYTAEGTARLTVTVGQQLHQAVQARIPHLPDVGGTAADGLDCGGHKVFVHAFNVGLPGKEKWLLTEQWYHIKKKIQALFCDLFKSMIAPEIL